MKRENRQWKERAHYRHDRIVDNIFKDPEELGNNVPHIKFLTEKVKEPYFPWFISDGGYRGSIVDILLIYECNCFIEICAIELKTGTHAKIDRGIEQIKKTKFYFLNNWQKWFYSDGIKNKISVSSLNSDFYFSGLLLKEKHLAPIEEWAIARCRVKLGKLF